MNTEPPEGDDLQRMLVSMKQNVLERAAPRPRRRTRRTGIAIGVVGVLLLGAAGGGVALGLIPTSSTTASNPTTSATPEAVPSEASSGAPVISRPTPTATPTPTQPPAAPEDDVADPSTWVISGAGIGPIAFGAPVADATNPLRGVWTGSDGSYCEPAVSIWSLPGFQTLTIGQEGGAVAAITIGGTESPTPTDPLPGPRTAEGVGVGTTYTQLRATYPDLVYDASVGTQDRTGVYAHWSLPRDGRFITFVLGDDGTVQSISVDTTAGEASPFCA